MSSAVLGEEEKEFSDLSDDVTLDNAWHASHTVQRFSLALWETLLYKTGKFSFSFCHDFVFKAIHRTCKLVNNTNL